MILIYQLIYYDINRFFKYKNIIAPFLLLVVFKKIKYSIFINDKVILEFGMTPYLLLLIILFVCIQFDSLLYMIVSNILLICGSKGLGL